MRSKPRYGWTRTDWKRFQQLFFFFEQTQREEEGLEWMDRLGEQHPRSFAPFLVKAQYYASWRDRWSRGGGAFYCGL